MNKNNNILIIGSIILILLINIVYSIKSSFGENLKLPSTGSVVINFKGVGSNPNDAGLTDELLKICIPPDFACYDYNGFQGVLNLIHVTNGTNNIYRFADYTISTSSTTPPFQSQTYYTATATYNNIMLPPSIEINDGDLLFTKDQFATTGYKVVFGTVADPSGINVDYINNIITIDTSKGVTQFNVDYIHNKLNTNPFPQGTITFQFPDDSDASCICAKVDDLLVNGVSIFKTGGNCTTGNKIIIFPGEFGFDPANPNIVLKMIEEGTPGSIYPCSGVGQHNDDQGTLNNWIQNGYRDFILVEESSSSSSFCYWVRLYTSDRQYHKIISNSCD
jgi:hypothetical protein